ncbi:MAG: HNH endonuclease [Chloroflexi bacterium]|nr:HNH endonuclease [Chloroflexota bacterium]MCH8892942.1 HNH endonuclease [Chloroflexota bacterium]
MKDEILTYWEMCARQGMALQRGMYFKNPPSHGIILMSRRKNAPYADEMSEDESILIYEGHDVRRTPEKPDPKNFDQPYFDTNDKASQNGLFASAAEDFKNNEAEAAIFRTYEKMRTGVWTDRGLYRLVNYSYQQDGERMVFKFWMESAGFDSTSTRETSEIETVVSRQIPSWVKQLVYKRDKGKCVICESEDQLHFDHEFPFSKGGTSVLPENVRILCARHNLEKGAKIE